MSMPAVEAARRAYTGNVWSKLSGKERGRYLFRIARIIQERARELAVLETIDNGKSIRESRDFDVPHGRTFFFTMPAGRTNSNYAFPGKQVFRARRCRTDHSLEFSTLDGGLENRPGPRLR